MTRPRIEIRTTFLTRVQQFLIYLFLLVSITILAINYNRLPDSVPIFFNWPSKENGYGSKSILWSVPIILGAISWLLLRLANRPWILNYPTRITLQNAKAQYTIAAQMLRLLSFLIAFACLALILISVTNTENGLSQIIERIYWVLPFLFFGLPLFFVLKLSLRRDK